MVPFPLHSFQADDMSDAARAKRSAAAAAASASEGEDDRQANEDGADSGAPLVHGDGQ